VAPIEADAGIGKTRLLREFRTQVQAKTPAANVLAGHCYEADQTVPDAPIADPLRAPYASLDRGERHARLLNHDD
jgi:hypothetical protein